MTKKQQRIEKIVKRLQEECPAVVSQYVVETLKMILREELP